MYLKTYREVDGVTKAKMEEMIGLWRTSGIDGGDLYGPGVRETIERDIFGSMGYQRQALPTRDRVLTTLHATLEAKSMAPPPAIQPPHAYPSLLQPPPPMDHPALVRTPAPNLPLFPPSIPRDPYAIPPRPAQIFVVPTPPRMPSTPVLSSATPGPSAPIPAQASTSLLSGIPANVADILRNLNTSGIKSAPRTPDRQAAKAEPKSRLEAYEDLIISLDVRLESLDLNQ